MISQKTQSYREIFGTFFCEKFQFLQGDGITNVLGLSFVQKYKYMTIIKQR